MSKVKKQFHNIFENSKNDVLRSLVKEHIRSYVLNEIDTTIEYETIPLGDNFEYGKYESIDVLNQIKQLRSRVNDILKKEPNSVFTFKINAGESQVTNPTGFETPGSLALSRTKQVRKYIEEVFGDLLSSKKITVISPDTINDVSIGKTPYRGKGSGDNTNPKLVPLYKKEQFVNLLFSGKVIKRTESNVPACNFTTQANGGVANSENDYLYKKYTLDVSKIEIGQKIKVVLDPHEVPDLLYVKAGKQEYNTGFVGVVSNYWTIMLATILHYTYTRQGKEIPNKFPKDIKDLPTQVAHNFFDRDSGLNEILGHIVKIGWSKKPSKNVDRIEWKTFEKTPIVNTGRDELFEGAYVGKVEFFKYEGLTTIDIEVYSPIGTTVWELKTACS